MSNNLPDNDKILDDIIAEASLAKSDKIKQQEIRNSELPPVDDAALNDLVTGIEKEEKYGDRNLESATLGAARSATLGISDQILTKFGRITGYTKEDLRNLREVNNIASTIGEITGVVAPTLLSGGTGAIGSAARALSTGTRAAETAGLAATQLTQKAFVSALAKEGKNSLAKKIVKDAIPKMIGSAVEGSAYGLGELVTENALGNLEFTAENAVAYAGTGALFGAAASGLFQAPKLLSPVGKKISKTVDDKINKFTSPESNVKKYLGMNNSDISYIENSSPSYFKEASKWLVEKANLQKLTKDSSLLKRIENIKNTSNKKLNDLFTRFDNIVAENDVINNINIVKRVGNISNIIREIGDEKLIKEVGLSKLNYIKNTSDEIVSKYLKNKKNVSFSTLRKLKQEIDDIIPYGRDTSKMEVGYLKNIRNEVNSMIEETAKDIDNAVGTNLAKEYLDLNKDINYSIITSKAMEKKIAKNEGKLGFIDFRDSALGMVLTSAFGAPGTAILAGKKLAESDFVRKINIIKAAEQSNIDISKKIDSGIKSFFKEQKFQPKKAAKVGLLSSSYAYDDNNKKPKDKQEAFKNTSKRITELVADPEKAQEIIARRTLHLQDTMPSTAVLATQTALKGLEFLNSKLPKQASSTSNVFSKREYKPSELQLSKFERYLEAVENPMSAIEDIQSGTLTREASEAIKTVYPNLFTQLQTKTLDELQNTKEPVSYAKRLQLGILLDIETDASLKSENIASLQNNLVSQASPAPTAARADKLSMAERLETKENRIAQK